MDIKWLLEHGPCKKFSKDENIPCSGESSTVEQAMYVLLSGRVDVAMKSAVASGQTLTSLKPGDIFGGREYFGDADDLLYTAGADSEVYLITEESFNDLSWSMPEILFDILRAAYQPTAWDDMPKTKKAVTATAPAQKSVKPAQTAVPKKAASPPVKATPPAKTAQAAPPPAKAAPPAKTAQAAKLSKSAEAASAKPVKDTQTATAPAVKEAASAASSVAPAISGEISMPEGSLFPSGHTKYPGITKPEFAALVFAKEYTCPFCKKPFKDFRVFRSKLFESEPMRYDMRKYFKEFQTEWYDILTCRNCLFSTFHNYFTDPKPMQKPKIESKLVEATRVAVMDFDAERDIDFVFTAHYLAILCAEAYPTMVKQLRAKLWGNLSWLYEDISQKELEIFATLRAAELYEQVYSETRLTPVQEQITLLSIAGMQHRAGIDRDLKKCLFKAKTHEMGDRTYAKIAEDFMYELKLVEEEQ